jgi:hypothetical protein
MTRATQKVWEAKSMWCKLKEKEKGKVNNLREKARMEELDQLIAKRLVIQEMINNLQK